MISTVDSGSHKVSGTSVNTDVLLVDVLLVNGSGNNCAVGSHHESPHLGIDCNVSHSCGNQDLIINLVDILSDNGDVIGSLVGLVSDTYSAGKIDELNVCSGFFFQFDSKLEKLSRKLSVVLIGNGVACKESVDTELLSSELC